ncbi:hypothetical protein E4U55_006186 [Claviceps digitariae]|nr:hypothetical protein E4U55_006186 [Claviceps digitariae]
MYLYSRAAWPFHVSGRDPSSKAVLALALALIRALPIPIPSSPLHRIQASTAQHLLQSAATFQPTSIHRVASPASSGPQCLINPFALGLLDLADWVP